MTAVYARISEDRRDGAGVERQLEDCRGLVARKGWAPTSEYVDNDISASSYSGKRRPQYQRMLAGVRSGELERIVVYHVDRLYRRPTELEELIVLAEQGQVSVVSVYSGDLDLSTSDGRLVARMLVNVAAKESEDKSHRIRRQRRQARAQGRPSGGRRAFGWKDANQPDPQEAALVLTATEAVIAGQSLAETARAWNRLGVHQPQGSRGWTADIVRQVLTSPRNAGLIAHRGQVLGKAGWPAIVPLETWERCHSVLDVRGDRSRFPRRRSMLTGLLHCGLCGAAMCRGVSGHGERRWRCKAAGTGPGGTCGKVSIAAAALEEFVFEATCERMDGGRLAELVQARLEGGELAEVSAELADLDRRLGEAAESYGAGRLSMRQFEQASVALEARQTALRGQLGRMTRSAASAPYLGRPGALRRAWPELSVDQHRAIIASAFGSFTILPAKAPGSRFEPSRVQVGEGA